MHQDTIKAMVKMFEQATLNVANQTGWTVELQIAVPGQSVQGEGIFYSLDLVTLQLEAVELEKYVHSLPSVNPEFYNPDLVDLVQALQAVGKDMDHDDHLDVIVNVPDIQCIRLVPPQPKSVDIFAGLAELASALLPIDLSQVDVSNVFNLPPLLYVQGRNVLIDPGIIEVLNNSIIPKWGINDKSTILSMIFPDDSGYSDMLIHAMDATEEGLIVLFSDMADPGIDYSQIIQGETISLKNTPKYIVLIKDIEGIESLEIGDYLLRRLAHGQKFHLGELETPKMGSPDIDKSEIALPNVSIGESDVPPVNEWTQSLNSNTIVFWIRPGSRTQIKMVPTHATITSAGLLVEGVRTKHIKPNNLQLAHVLMGNSIPMPETTGRWLVTDLSEITVLTLQEHAVRVLSDTHKLSTDVMTAPEITTQSSEDAPAQSVELPNLSKFVVGDNFLLKPDTCGLQAESGTDYGILMNVEAAGNVLLATFWDPGGDLTKLNWLNLANGHAVVPTEGSVSTHIFDADTTLQYYVMGERAQKEINKLLAK